MKIFVRENHVIKAVSLFIATFLIITSVVVTANASEEPEMKILGKDGFNLFIPDVTVEPGTTGHVMEVTGEWSEEIFGFFMKIEYGTTLVEEDITITNITFDGCVVETPESALIQINNLGTTGYILIHSIFNSTPPYVPGEGIAAGSGRLFNIIIDINETAEEQELDFTEGSDTTCRFYLAPNFHQEIDVTPGVLTIAYPLPELTINSITGGTGITATIENTGTSDATNIEWTITIQGGLIILTPDSTGTVSLLGPGESEVITMSVFGIGLGIITTMPKIVINANCDEGVSTDVEAEAKILFSSVTIQ